MSEQRTAQRRVAETADTLGGWFVVLGVVLAGLGAVLVFIHWSTLRDVNSDSAASFVLLALPSVLLLGAVLVGLGYLLRLIAARDLPEPPPSAGGVDY